MVGDGHGPFHLRETHMQIRLLQHLVGPSVNVMPGETVDLPDDAALRLIAAGAAEAVASQPKDERATPAEAPRKAVKR